MQEHKHHAHSHSHGTPLKKALILTSIFMLVEIIGGYYTNSLALISDGVHMVTDAAALAMSLVAFYFSSRPASLKRSFGFYRIEILAAFANGIFLIGLSVLIISDSWQRLGNPQPIKPLETFGIALVGLLFNLYSVSILLKADRKNLNIKGALFHVVGDLFGSVGAVTAALIAQFTGYYKADPIAGMIISALIIVSAWRLVMDTVNVMLEAAPSHIDVHEVQRQLMQIPHVDEVHDLHVWCITSEIVSLSAHVVSKSAEGQKLLISIRDCLREKFDITHVTIQIERESLRKMEPHI